MKKIRLLGTVLIFLLASLSIASNAGAQGTPHVDVLTFDGAISTAAFDYFDRGIETAEQDGASCVIIQLNTPGGDAGATLKITQRFENARVPVVVFIWPRGSLAASAGTYITLAAHVAAMAPKTTIGAAAPVSGQGQELPETAKEKLVNTLAGQAKNFAQRRGEEAAEWAEKAVRESLVATEQEALEKGIIDLIAEDLDDLLAQLDGREVMVGSQEFTLHTRGATVTHIPMTFVEQLLSILINPNVAFILLTLGVNGLLFELSSPGGYVAGIVGSICLLLSLYSFQVLSVNYMGLALIALAFVLFVLDIKAPTHGVLTAGGIVTFALGALILFNSPYYAVSRSLIFSVALATGAFFAFVMTKALRAQKWHVTTGREGLIGQIAEVRTDLTPEGTVFLRGEYWQATLEEGTAQKGEKVQVIDAEGFRLRVRKLED
jgi:membrane-bound serine protease (ClpP class)